jgi:hypothetical protein
MGQFMSSTLSALSGGDGIGDDDGALGPHGGAPRPSYADNPAFRKRQRVPLSPVDAHVEALASKTEDASHDLERHAKKLEREESAAIGRARTRAQQGDMRGAAQIATVLVKTRIAKTRLNKAAGRLKALQGRMRVIQANAAIAACAKQTVEIMKILTAALAPAELQRLVQGLAEESERLNMAQETIDEALDDLDDADADALDGEGHGDLSEATIMRAICDECAIDLSAAMPDAVAPARPVKDAQPAPAPALADADEGPPDANDALLQQRLQVLQNKEEKKQ